MRRNGIRFVVMHEERFRRKSLRFLRLNARLARSPYLEFLASDGNSLYRVKGEAVDSAGIKEASPVAKAVRSRAPPRKVGTVIEDPKASGGQGGAGRKRGDPPGFLAFGPEQVYPTGGVSGSFPRPGGAREDSRG